MHQIEKDNFWRLWSFPYRLFGHNWSKNQIFFKWRTNFNSFYFFQDCIINNNISCCIGSVSNNRRPSKGKKLHKNWKSISYLKTNSVNYYFKALLIYYLKNKIIAANIRKKNFLHIVSVVHLWFFFDNKIKLQKCQNCHYVNG